MTHWSDILHSRTQYSCIRTVSAAYCRENSFQPANTVHHFMVAMNDVVYALHISSANKAAQEMRVCRREYVTLYCWFISVTCTFARSTLRHKKEKKQKSIALCPREMQQQQHKQTAEKKNSSSCGKGVTTKRLVRRESETKAVPGILKQNEIGHLSSSHECQRGWYMYGIVCVAIF